MWAQQIGPARLFSGRTGISEILLDGQRQGFEFELIAKAIHPLKVIEHLKRSQADSASCPDSGPCKVHTQHLDLCSSRGIES